MEEEKGLLIPKQINALDIYTEGKIDPLLEEITRKVKEFIPSVETDKSRKEIASMAYKVSQSKTWLDNLGKELVTDWKAKAKQVDISRKHIRDYLDDLRNDVRKPLTDWELEQKKKAEEAKKLEEFNLSWEEAIYENLLFDRKKELERREAILVKQEEERKQREEAERLAREQKEREERIAREAAEAARKEAEEKAEKERQAILAREAEARIAVERAEKKRLEDVERAEREKQEAIENERRIAVEEAHKKECARLEAERVEKERLDRIEAEKLAREKAEREEAERKAADFEHREQINLAILADLVDNEIDEEVGKRVIILISKGFINHVQINY